MKAKLKAKATAKAKTKAKANNRQDRVRQGNKTGDGSVSYILKVLSVLGVLSFRAIRHGKTGDGSVS